MSFSFEDDEGEFGGGPGGSKLSSLFGMDKASHQGGNESLTFTAPKQPKKSGKGSDSSSGQNKSSLLLAVAVHAYRFNNGTYIKHGKLGAAILGNHSTSDYKILLYISKMQQVTHVKLNPQFLFTIQANNYASFFDEQRQNWSIMFESEQNAVDFAKQVALAKLNSANGVTSSVIDQDLMMGKGDPVASGDSVEVKYTGWLYQSKMFGDVFDSNANVDKPFRFKIGKGKVIKGWEEGVLGMKKGGRRLLIIPSSHGYGKKGLSSRIPPNATLIFDIEIKKIKVTRDKDDIGSISSDAGEITKSSDERGPSPNPNLMKNGPELPRTDIHSSKSDLEPSSPTTTSKAKLISRMAKMGQPMLPLAGAAVATDNSSDSEADEASASSDTGGPSLHSTIPLPRKPVKAPRRNVPSPSPPMPQQHQQQPRMDTTGGHHQLAIYQSQQQVQGGPQQPMGVNQPPMQQYPQQPIQGNVMFGSTGHPHHPHQQPLTAPPMSQAPMGQPMGYHHQIPPVSAYPGTMVHGQTTAADVASSSLVLSEARQHHSDLRQTVIQVSDQLGHISQKIDSLQSNQMSASIANSVPSMEANILMQNIQRIMQENERLKKEVYEKSSKIETQNDKISELLQRNQMYVEENNSMLEKRNDTYKQTAAQSQLRVLELEQEKVKMTTDLSTATSKLSKLQLELGEVQQKEFDLRTKLSKTMASTEDQQGEVDILKVQSREAEKKLETVSRTLKEERLFKKQLETKLGNLEEEMTDLKTEKEVIEKNLADRKKKAASEKQKSQEESDEMRKTYEEEISSLKSRLRQAKTSTDLATAEQVAQIEKELDVQFKERSERMIAQAKETHQREMTELKEENKEMARKLASTEQKMLSLRSLEGSNKQEVDTLKVKLEETQVWKEKYDALHTNALSMKEKYEKRIVDLMKEKSTPPPETESSSQDVVDEVKKVMNNVYHSLKSEFDAGSNYKGSEILSTIMNTIKVTTIRLVQQQASQEDGESEEESDDEEEEEEEDEDTEEEQFAVEEQVPLQSSAPPPQERESIPDLPEVDQSSQEGGSQQGDGERAEGGSERAEGDNEEQHHEETHDENPESEVSTEHHVSNDASQPSDQLENIPDLPQPSSDTVEADSQPFQQQEDNSRTDNLTDGIEDESSHLPEGEEVEGDDLTEDAMIKPEEGSRTDVDESVEESGTSHGTSAPEDHLPEGQDVGADDSTEDAKIKDGSSEEVSKSHETSAPEGDEQTEDQLPEGDVVVPEDDPLGTGRGGGGDTAVQEDEKVEVEQAERAAADPLSVPIMTREPPEAPPELPPDFPGNDEDEEPEDDRKRSDGGLFGDDSDSDDFFDAVPPAKKTTQTKPAAATPTQQEEDEESLKPKPPPPLFGDSDDDDDLWMK